MPILDSFCCLAILVAAACENSFSMRVLMIISTCVTCTCWGFDGRSRAWADIADLASSESWWSNLLISPTVMWANSHFSNKEQWKSWCTAPLYSVLSVSCWELLLAGRCTPTSWNSPLTTLPSQMPVHPAPVLQTGPVIAFLRCSTAAWVFLGGVTILYWAPHLTWPKSDRKWRH